MKERMIESFGGMISKQTNFIKQDVVGLENRLHDLDLRLKSNCSSEKNLIDQIRDMRAKQNSFHDRVTNMLEKLNTAKTLLASYHS